MSLNPRNRVRVTRPDLTIIPADKEQKPMDDTQNQTEGAQDADKSDAGEAQQSEAQQSDEQPAAKPKKAPDILSGSYTADDLAVVDARGHRVCYVSAEHLDIEQRKALAVVIAEKLST